MMMVLNESSLPMSASFCLVNLPLLLSRSGVGSYPLEAGLALRLSLTNRIWWK